MSGRLHTCCLQLCHLPTPPLHLLFCHAFYKGRSHLQALYLVPPSSFYFLSSCMCLFIAIGNLRFFPPPIPPASFRVSLL